MSTIIGLFLLCCTAEQALGQKNTFPEESMRLMLNRTFFIPGEELSVALEVESTADFTISQVAYLELLGPDKSPVIQQKVALQDGRGLASIYLPSYLKSGVYSFVAYTRWMRNFGLQSLPVRKVHIINPFIALPSSLFAAHEDRTAGPQTDPLQTQCTVDESSGAFEFHFGGNVLSGTMEIWHKNRRLYARALSGTSVKIHKKELPRGLITFRIMEDNNEVLMVRAFFLSPKKLPAKISLSQSSFRPGDSIKVHVKVEGIKNINLNIRRIQPKERKENWLESYFLGYQNGLSSLWPAEEITDADLQSYQPNFPSLSHPIADTLLPDYRGELIEGVVWSQNQNPVTYRSLLAGYQSGNEYYIRWIRTDGKGRFRFTIPLGHQAENLSFSKLQEGEKVKVWSGFLGQYDFIKESEPLVIDKKDTRWLTEKSKQVQIQNIYSAPPFTKKQTQKLSAKGYSSAEVSEKYNLDDFTRFPTVKDHVVEYVSTVGIKNVDNEPAFFMKNIENSTVENAGVLCLLNGLRVSPKEILAFDPLKIETIQVTHAQLVLGSEIYSGAIHFFTYPNQPVDFSGLGNHYYEPYEGVKESDAVPRQEALDRRTPDMRTQVAWRPNAIIQGERTFRYQLPDIPGIYEIVITGASTSVYVYKSVLFEIKE